MRLHEALSFLRPHGILGTASSCVGHVVALVPYRCAEIKNILTDITVKYFS